MGVRRWLAVFVADFAHGTEPPSEMSVTATHITHEVRNIAACISFPLALWERVPTPGFNPGEAGEGLFVCCGICKLPSPGASLRSALPSPTRGEGKRVCG